MAVAYGIIFALSLLMPPLYFLTVHKKQDEPWLFVLFLCVCAVNLGYLLISVSQTVEFALWANKITYFGQVFVPLCMFMIISKLCGFAYKKWLVGMLIGLAAVMFGIVFTTGWLDWYYVSATLENANGASYLVKEYGILHPTNLIYVVVYFVAMIVTIGISLKKNRDASQKLAGFMLAIVIGNIGMWIVEKIVEWNFEMLSISYLMSVFAFYFVYILLQDYILKKDLPNPAVLEEKPTIVVVDNLTVGEKMKIVLAQLTADKTLTVKETEVLEQMLDGKSRKEIAKALGVSENTAKTHVAHLYEKLGISSRQQLLAILYKN